MKIFLNAACWIAIIYAAFVAAVYLIQRDMMYMPTSIKYSAKDAGILGLEEINIVTDDGLSLYGWYKKPDIDGYPVIVWFHGNGSNLGWSAARAMSYLKAGYGALFTEYRGYSGNNGEPTEEGLYNDARAFIAWLFGEGYQKEDIILYGESIGSGPAVKMAGEYKGVHALVLETPFTSAVDVAAKHYPFLPTRWMLKDRYDNLSRIDSIDTKLIIAHGTGDRIIPYAFGERLFTAASQPKALITIEGGDHNNLDEYGLAHKVLEALKTKDEN